MCFASKPFFKQNEMSTIRPFPSELSHSKRARKALTLGLSWCSVGPAQLHSFNLENRTFAVADLQSAKLSSQCIGPYLAPKTPCSDWWIAATRHECTLADRIYTRKWEKMNVFSPQAASFSHQFHPVSKATGPHQNVESQLGQGTTSAKPPEVVASVGGRVWPATDSAVAILPSPRLPSHETNEPCLCSKLIKRCLIHTSSRAWLKRQEAK